jgi:hypothetical protein
MLKDLNDCLYEAVNEDCTDECLKDVTEDLTGLKEVDVVIFNLKSFLNEYATNASISTFHFLFFDGFLLPFFRFLGGLYNLRLPFLKKDKILHAKESHDLRKKFILSQQDLGLMYVKRKPTVLK